MYLNQMKENGDYGYKLGPNGTKYSGYETLNMAVDLIWEEARKQDLGIDLKLFNDDLSIIFDIFKERRENILLKRENSIPSFLGYNTSAPYGNIGIVENKGFDATVEYNKRFNKDWTLAIRGNITYNKDKWIEGELPEQRYDWMNQYGQNILGKKDISQKVCLHRLKLMIWHVGSLCPRQIKLLLRSRLLLSLVR